MEHYNCWTVCIFCDGRAKYIRLFCLAYGSTNPPPVKYARQLIKVQELLFSLCRPAILNYKYVCICICTVSSTLPSTYMLLLLP